MKDYYTILGVPRQASQDEIAAAYRKLAADPANRERIAEIQKAYELLSDPGARDIYDQGLRLRESEARPAAARSPRPPRPVARPVVEAETGTGQFWLILVAAIVVVGGLLLYGHFSREQEKLRLEREREVAMRAQQAEEERKQREEADLAKAEELRTRREIEEIERRNQLDSERALQDSERRSERDRAQARADAQREEYLEAKRERDAREELARQERERREREREQRERERHNKWILERPTLH